MLRYFRDQDVNVRERSEYALILLENVAEMKKSLSVRIYKMKQIRSCDLIRITNERGYNMKIRSKI